MDRKVFLYLLFRLFVLERNRQRRIRYRGIPIVI